MRYAAEALVAALLTGGALYAFLQGGGEERLLVLGWGAGTALLLNGASYTLLFRLGGGAPERLVTLQLLGALGRTALFCLVLVVGLWYSGLPQGSLIASMLIFHGVLFGHETIAACRLVRRGTARGGGRR